MIDALGGGDDDRGANADAATVDAAVVGVDAPVVPDAAPGLVNPGFIIPDQTPVAYLNEGGVWVEQGPADFSCLNTASDDVASVADRTLTGMTEDFQSGSPVDNVDLAIFDSGIIGGTPLATANSDAAGDYAITIPAGTKRLSIRSTDPETTRFFDTYVSNVYYGPGEPSPMDDLASISFLTANALPAFVGVTRTQGTGMMTATLRDCQQREVQGVIGTVSSTSCRGIVDCEPAHLDGAQTFYFSAGATSLPVRLTQQESTNKDGQLLLIELPPSTEGFLQVWGFPTAGDLAAGDLRLLAEISSPVLAEAMIMVSMEPLRTGT